MDIETYIDSDLLTKFEFYNYGHALEILHDAFPAEWGELQDCLRKLKLTLADIKKAGGNESPIPKKFDDVLYQDKLRSDCEKLSQADIPAKRTFCKRAL